MYIPESTVFLLEKGLFKYARPDIEYLLKFNKASEEAKVIARSLLDRCEAKKKSVFEVNLKKLKNSEAKPSMIKSLMSDKLALRNLVMMIMVWVSSSFTFYLLNFLVKYMPGDIYFNSVVSGLSCCAMLLEGTMQNWLGVRGGMLVSFVATVISTVWLCFFD